MFWSQACTETRAEDVVAVDVGDEDEEGGDRVREEGRGLRWLESERPPGMRHE